VRQIDPSLKIIALYPKNTEQTTTNLLLAGHANAATNFMGTQLATLPNVRAGSTTFRELAYTENYE
jgi:hypothetical protein